MQHIFSSPYIVFTLWMLLRGNIPQEKTHVKGKCSYTEFSLLLPTYISVFILSTKYPHGWWATWERTERNTEQGKKPKKMFISSKKLCSKWRTGTTIFSQYSKFFTVSNHIHWGHSPCICTSLLIYLATPYSSNQLPQMSGSGISTYPVIIPCC